jgi:cobalt-zinc-cadmium efflux system outer membrane protein
MYRNVLIVLLTVFSAGCAIRSTSPGVADVSRSINERMGYALRDAQIAAPMPPGAVISDGLTDEETVAIALWNHAPFQADLARLGFTRADVVEAGLLRNPIFSLLFPIGPKQLEATFNWPIDAFWQRPHRLAAAKLDAERAAEDLVQNGLNLVRDARLAHADAVLSIDRIALNAEQTALRRQILEITEARFRRR